MQWMMKVKLYFIELLPRSTQIAPLLYWKMGDLDQWPFQMQRA